MINAVMLRDLPFDEPDRLVSCDRAMPVARKPACLTPTSATGARRRPTFAGLAAQADGDDERARGRRGAPSEFRGTLRQRQYVRAAADGADRRARFSSRGRSGQARPPVVIIGYGVWQGRYGGDPAVIGRTVRVNDVPATVDRRDAGRLQVPVSLRGLAAARASFPARRIHDAMRARSAFSARLRDGVELAQARADLDTIAARLAREYPATNTGHRGVCQTAQRDPRRASSGQS